MDTSDESSPPNLTSQPSISFTSSSSSSFDLSPSSNNDGNNNDTVISSRTNDHSNNWLNNNWHNNDLRTQRLPSSNLSQQSWNTNDLLLPYNNNENDNDDDENSNGNNALSRKRGYDYLDSEEFDSSFYDDVDFHPSIFDTVQEQYDQLSSQSSFVVSRRDGTNYIGGSSVMLVISKQSTADPAPFLPAINIFVPDKFSHTAKCLVAFFEDDPLYSIKQVSCSSMEEWRSSNADHNVERLSSLLLNDIMVT